MFDAHLSDSASALRAIAFYLPQFHPVPENDAFWGRGFTDWRNVVRSRPRFRGHEQPQLPADLGFYDLREAETRQAQADLARAAGLHGFCYYHYWFSGKRVLHRPFDAVLATGEPKFPFMLCWANENWTRAWDGGADELLLMQRSSEEDTISHARHLTAAFSDPRYIRIDGRPVFAVYNTDALPCPEAWADTFRRTCSEGGIAPYLIRVERYLDQDRRPPQALGFDAALDFQPFSRSFHTWLCSRPDLRKNPLRRVENRLRKTWQNAQRWRQFDTHYDLQAYVAFDMCRTAPDYTLHPGVTPSWDNSARRPSGQAIIFRGATPKLFADWVTSKRRACQQSDQSSLLFINAWNEWAEGNHLEPCLQHGHAWLQALRDGLGVTSLQASVAGMETSARSELPSES